LPRRDRNDAHKGRKGLLIQDRLSEAQDGQAFTNLARAFHLPPTKVEPAVGAMIASLLVEIGRKKPSRRFLAKLVELLGKDQHQQVLENPTLLGATSTQVLGNEALGVIAGRDASKTIARQAAAAAGVSEMIAEYLLPVIAAMLVGALAKASRTGLEGLMRDDADAPSDSEPSPVIARLPQVAAGGMGFSGSTGGSVGLASPVAISSRHAELAESIRLAGRVPGATDAAEATRRVLAPILGGPKSPFDWIGRLRAWGRSVLNAAPGRRQR